MSLMTKEQQKLALMLLKEGVGIAINNDKREVTLWTEEVDELVSELKAKEDEQVLIENRRNQVMKIYSEQTSCDLNKKQQDVLVSAIKNGYHGSISKED